MLLFASRGGRLVDLETQVRITFAPRVGDVDDPGGSDRCGRLRDAPGEVEVRELVDLEQVRVPVAGERFRHLRDRVLGPGQVGENLDLGPPPVLDLGDVDDPQAARGERRWWLPMLATVS